MYGTTLNSPLSALACKIICNMMINSRLFKGKTIQIIKKILHETRSDEVLKKCVVKVQGNLVKSFSEVSPTAVYNYCNWPKQKYGTDQSMVVKYTWRVEICIQTAIVCCCFDVLQGVNNSNGIIIHCACHKTKKKLHGCIKQAKIL